MARLHVFYNPLNGHSTPIARLTVNEISATIAYMLVVLDFTLMEQFWYFKHHQQS